MRPCFLHPGGGHTDVAGALAEFGQVRRTEVAHAGLDAADELRQCALSGPETSFSASTPSAATLRVASAVLWP